MSPTKIGPFFNPRDPCAFWKNHEPYFPKGCEVIFMGTITTVEGMKKGYFYFSDNNQFWNIMDAAFKAIGYSRTGFVSLKISVSKTAHQIRSDFHKKYNDLHIVPWKMAVCDIIKNCYFDPPSSSSDNDIVKYNTINYYWPHPIDYLKSLKAIVANSWATIKFCKKSGLIPRGTIINKNHPWCLIKTGANKDLKIFYVPSPSPRNTSMKYVDKVKAWAKVLKSI